MRRRVARIGTAVVELGVSLSICRQEEIEMRAAAVERVNAVLRQSGARTQVRFLDHLFHNREAPTRLS